jgi:hypothetical protein
MAPFIASNALEQWQISRFNPMSDQKSKNES